MKSCIGAPRGSRIRPDLVAYVVPIGRYALEAAINEAVSQKELHSYQSELKRWSHIAGASQDVAKALERLFRAIDPDGKEAEHFAPFIRQSRGSDGFRASNAGYRAAAKGALRDARILMKAKPIIGKLHADTVTRRDALVKQYRHSPQDHQKRGFVRILAEGWIFLTEKMPSKQRDPSKNPFLRVVEAAWLDWLEEDSSDTEAFGDALHAVISSIDEARLNKLCSDGPEWLIYSGLPENG